MRQIIISGQTFEIRVARLIDYRYNYLTDIPNSIHITLATPNVRFRTNVVVGFRIQITGTYKDYDSIKAGLARATIRAKRRISIRQPY